MPGTECAQILGVGVLLEGSEGPGLSWLEEHWARGTLVEGLGAGNQEERGKGQSSVQRRIGWRRTEGVLSNQEVAAAGRGAAQFASSKLLSGEAGGRGKSSLPFTCGPGGGYDGCQETRFYLRNNASQEQMCSSPTS